MQVELTEENKNKTLLSVLINILANQYAMADTLIRMQSGNDDKKFEHFKSELDRVTKEKALDIMDSVFAEFGTLDLDGLFNSQGSNPSSSIS